MEHSLLKIAKVLSKLLTENPLPSRKFSTNTSLIHKLRSLGVITLESKEKGRGKLVSKGEFFQAYLERNFNGNPTTFISADSRSKLIHDYGDDKAIKISPQKGLYLWSKDNIPVTPSTTINNEEGVITFVQDRINISPSDDITLVGIENFESLSYASFLYEHFSLPNKCLFVYRNSSFNKLIKSISLGVLYIPDYDIFGIRIFETEILKNNPTAQLLLPYKLEDVFTRIDTSKKYFTQLHMKGSNYSPSTEEGKYILKLIKKHKKIIPQEYFHYSISQA